MPKDLSNEEPGEAGKPAVSAKASLPQSPLLFLPPPASLLIQRKLLVTSGAGRVVRGTAKAALWAPWSLLPAIPTFLP